MIYKIASSLGFIIGVTMIGLGIGFGLPAVIIGGIFFAAIGVVGSLFIKM